MLDQNARLTQLACMNGAGPADNSEYAALVMDETIRRALRKTPQEHFDSLRAALRHAEKRGLIPKRDRAAHERKLLQMFEKNGDEAV